MMTRGVYVGLGSNLSSPQTQVRRAMQALELLPQTRVLACSSLYRSTPISHVAQPDFINAVAELETALPPRVLLDALLDLEQEFGRTRQFRDAPRTLDLDLLLYGDLRQHDRDLTLPHPRMHLREFVLLPLLEIAPDCVIPGVGSAAEAARLCAEQGVEKLE